MSGRWWDTDPREIFWLETTDRDDIGRDLNAPQRNEVGNEYPGYSFITELGDTDVIFHYSKRARTISHWSRVIGDAYEDAVVWGAHGTSARGKHVEPYRRPGWRRGLDGPFSLEEPMTLEALRAHELGVTQVRDQLEAAHGNPLYFPLELSDKRPLRPTQFYLSKLPAELVAVLPGLETAAERAQATRATPSAPAPTATGAGLGAGYRREDEDSATTQRDPFFVDPSVVDRGVRGHARTQNQLADYVQALGRDAWSHVAGEPAFDLAWETDQTIYVAEVKSITNANEERQLRLGLGQLLRYRQLLSGKRKPVRAVLVVERKPSDANWLELCQELGILVAWPPAFTQLHEQLAIA